MVMTLPKLTDWIPAEDLARIAAERGVHRKGNQRNGKLEPAPADVQDEFAALMVKAGVRPHRGGDEHLHCPWHPDDKTRSLHVHWVAAAFCCFSDACGVRGGLSALRKLVGVEAPARPITRLAPQPERRIDVERERMRLSSAMKSAGLTDFDRTTGRAAFEEVIECRHAWRLFQAADGCKDKTTFSCGFQLCPICTPTRLAADFLRHRDKLPDCRFSLFRISPPDGMTDRREISVWFKTWRRGHRIEAGFYGIRQTIGRPDVLLVIPNGAEVGDVSPDVVGADFDATVAWYQQMILEEITSWRTPDEMVDLLASTKGRRRFQGFGTFFERKSEDADSAEPKKVHRASGGSAKGKMEPRFCPHGERYRFVKIVVSEEEAEAWVRGPPR